MTDVDMSDILLTIARQVSNSLEQLHMTLEPKGFQGVLNKAWSLLQSDVSLTGAGTIPGVGKVAASAEAEQFKS